MKGGLTRPSDKHKKEGGRLREREKKADYGNGALLGP